MGFTWVVNVFVAYVQPVEYFPCTSRFATRCLKLQQRVEPPPQTDHPKKSKRRNKKNEGTLPGKDLTQEEWEEGCPFSDTEDEVKAMSPEHQKLHAEIKKRMEGDHAGELHNWCDFEELGEECFRCAVERILPGHGGEFSFRHNWFGGAHGEVGEGAKEDLMYIEYKPSFCRASDADCVDVGRGGVNVPWGFKLTPLRLLKDEERAQVDAAFAVLVDKLGLTATGKPDHMLVTLASGG
jgi:hypothetical protein